VIICVELLTSVINFSQSEGIALCSILG